MKFEIGPEVINSYKRLSYTPWHAIAEFVDNSTQAYFNNKDLLDAEYSKASEKLTVSIEFHRQERLIKISDNSIGMSKTELANSLRVGRPPADTTGRSKYGMGLKTAACWLGEKWTIRTKKLGSTKELSVSIDVNEIARGRMDLEPEERSSTKSEHYTVIEISEMNRAFAGRTVGKIKKFLGSMYREDFRNDRLRLFWGSEAITWEDDESKFLTNAGGKPLKKSFKFRVDTKEVSGWVGILRKGSREEAGFSILHSGRMIKGYPDSWRPSSIYGQFQGSNDLINQRLVGEIHLDEFDVSHTKDDILWLGSQEEDVENKLYEKCSDYRHLAITHRSKAAGDSRGPSETEVESAIDEFKEELNSPELADSVQVDDVIPPEEAVKRSVKSIADSVKKSREETFKSIIGSLTVRLYLVRDMSENDPYVVIDSANASDVSIVVNRTHPHWNEIKGANGVLNFLRHCTYDGIAEWQASKKAGRVDPETIKLFKDKLLRVPMQIERHSTETDES